MKQFNLTMACAATVLTLAWGCGRDDDAMRTTETAPPAATDAAPASDASIRVADIVGEPDRYLGQTVTVVADVEEVLSPMAFALDEDSPLAGGIDNDLLVFSPQASSLSEIDDQWLNNKVRVTGTVGKMSVVEIEREVGWDLDSELEVEVEKASAVLIAKSIERVR